MLERSFDGDFVKKGGQKQRCLVALLHCRKQVVVAAAAVALDRLDCFSLLHFVYLFDSIGETWGFFVCALCFANRNKSAERWC